MVARLIILGGAAYGGWWAYQNGHLDAVIERLGLPFGDGVGQGATPASAAIPEGNSGIRELDWLTDNIDVVSDWSRRNLIWTAAMMHQESRGKPGAKSHANARGLMQVIPSTAQQMWNAGNRKFSADPANLYDPRASIYFGTAYLQYLSGIRSDRDWMTRAYNAGPGGQRKDGTWPRETVDYLAKVKQHYARFTASVRSA